MIIRLVQCSLVGLTFLTWSTWANAACYGPDQQVSAETVSSFLGNPGQLLTQFPNGGAQLISQVRDLVASDPAALQAIIGLLATASKDQQSAIGSGLGQAARICASRDQAFATQIQEAVAASGNKDLSDAYAAVTLNVPIGAVGGAGGAGGAGGTGIGGATGGPTGTNVGSEGAGLNTSPSPNSYSTPTGTNFGGLGFSAGTTTGAPANTSVSNF